MGLGWACLLATWLALAGGLTGCRDGAAPAGAPRSAEAGVPSAAAAPAGAVRSPSGAVISVVGIRRTARDVIQVDLLAVNGGAGALDLAGEFARGGGLSQASLLSDDGRAQVFVLADGEGAPQCSSPVQALAPGAHQALYLRFAAQRPSAHRVTLRLPGVEPALRLEVPAAEGAP